MRHRLVRLGLPAVLGAVLGCAVTDDSGNGAAKPFSPENTGIAIVIRDSYFYPGSDTVAAGKHVVWVNQGKLPHGVMLVTPNGNRVIMQPGNPAFDTVFTDRGMYRYYCPRMTGMAGSILVQ